MLVQLTLQMTEETDEDVRKLESVCWAALVSEKAIIFRIISNNYFILDDAKPRFLNVDSRRTFLNPKWKYFHF